MFCGKIEYLQRWKIFIGTMCLNSDYIGVLTDLNEFLSDTIPPINLIKKYKRLNLKIRFKKLCKKLIPFYSKIIFIKKINNQGS